MTTTPDYRFVDADQHYYEPDDCFTRYLEPAYRDTAVHVRSASDGTDLLYIGDRPARFFPRKEGVAKPGAMIDFFRGVTDARPLDERVPSDSVPAYVDRDARLTCLDALNTEAAILLPSMGFVVEAQMWADGLPPAAIYAQLRAFNRWIEDDWGYCYKDRLFGVPLLSLGDPELATAEVERVLEAGARILHIQAMPTGRSPVDPAFDPFWARINEASAVVAVHGADSGYVRYTADWGENSDASFPEYSAFQNFVAAPVDRPVMDFMAALVLNDLFGQFPNIRVLSIENGSAWVPYFLRKANKAHFLATAMGSGRRPQERPSTIFRRHVFVTTFYEEKVAPLTDLIGIDQVILGSDYPHPEGTSRPEHFLEKLVEFDAPDVRRIMRDNVAELLGLQRPRTTAEAPPVATA